MSLIKCDDCSAIHESTLPACPGCGRCEGCGCRRISTKELESLRRCSNCSASVCASCARCHACGEIWVFDCPACECGFPDDPAQVKKIEEIFAVNKKENTGCFSVLFCFTFVSCLISLLIHLQQ